MALMYQCDRCKTVAPPSGDQRERLMTPDGWRVFTGPSRGAHDEVGGVTVTICDQCDFALWDWLNPPRDTRPTVADQQRQFVVEGKIWDDEQGKYVPYVPLDQTVDYTPPGVVDGQIYDPETNAWVDWIPNDPPVVTPPVDDIRHPRPDWGT